MERNCKCSNCYIVGPTGPKGEADTIEVRNTITVEPSQDARVIDTYNAGKHILDFEIPRGESSSKVFGYKYSDVGNIINLTKQVGEIITLNRTGTSSGIDVLDNNHFIILENGIYKIEYYFSGSIANDTAFFTEILRNDEVIDGTTISKDLITNTDSDFYGATVLELEQNDFISLSVRANADTVLTLAPDINAYVIITKFV